LSSRHPQETAFKAMGPPMTDTNDETARDFLAEARKNLKTTVTPQPDYRKAGRDAGKALARALFGKFSDRQPPLASLSDRPKSAAGRAKSSSTKRTIGVIGRVVKGFCFLWATQFVVIATTLISIWLAALVAGFAIFVCFTRKWKNHGISSVVGVLLLILAPLTLFAMWSSQQEEQALPALRQSNPTVYLEKAKRHLSREAWLDEAKILVPSLYEVENAKDVAAKAAEQQRLSAEQKRIDAEQQAKVEEEVAENQQASCRENWAKCKDNTDIMKNYKNYRDAAYSCKDAANNQASYGTPDWPWGAFETYRTGDSGPKSGEIELIEGRAKFENGFGAMKRVFVRCVYDLNSRKVQYVEIN
jgi:hypothetical protein